MPAALKCFPSLIRAPSAADTLGAQIIINPNGGTITNSGLLQATAGGSLIIDSPIVGAGKVLVDANSFLSALGLVGGSLTVAGSAVIRAGAGNAGTSKLSSLSIVASGSVFVGKLDLSTNKLIVQTTDFNDKSAKITALNAAIVSGSNAGTWTGNGITSSTVAPLAQHYGVALYDNGNLQLTTFGGLPVDSNSLLVTLAHLGDANGNGVVDIQDQSIVTNHWQQVRTHWDTGDLNNDGFVDIQDLTIVTNNWQQISIFSLDADAATPGSAPSFFDSSLTPQNPSSVPEPVSLLFLVRLPLLPMLTSGARARRTQALSQNGAVDHIACATRPPLSARIPASPS